MVEISLSLIVVVRQHNDGKHVLLNEQHSTTLDYPFHKVHASHSKASDHAVFCSTGLTCDTQEFEIECPVRLTVGDIINKFNIRHSPLNVRKEVLT
jgi:hypothetical protein